MALANVVDLFSLNFAEIDAAVIARWLPAWTDVTAIPMAEISSSGDWGFGTAITDSLVDDPRLRYPEETDSIAQNRQRGKI